ncbi:MAG: 4Fe-4S dicluster domain-containing protein [Acidobacteria bacterium]|nr:4Fe-4S dicluster domain-containing protein [Acidobacteriota bacterium]
MRVEGLSSVKETSQLVDACVHCGFCLPACPTYALWGEEMDSPRGRIYLMKAALEERAAVSATFVRHIDACLGCLACVPACPSGVRYDVLIERTRAQIERGYRRSLSDRLYRDLLFRVLPYPVRLRVAFALSALVRPLIDAVVGTTQAPPPRQARPDTRMRALVALAPRRMAQVANVPVHTAARTSRRASVGVLTGCVQRFVCPQVNQATVNVLSTEGCEVIVPSAQSCCGALSLHAGRTEEARGFARRTIEAFERAGVECVAVNSAGCGSAMKQYGDLLADDERWATRAREFSTRVRDVSELLVDLGEPRAPRHPLRMRVAYQDACHLSHAQRVHSQPRQLLATIPGLEILEIAEPDMCCGSAGIYNLVEPEPAFALGDRKAAHIAALQPDVISTANPGCRLHLAAACARRGFTRPMLHPIELVDASIRALRPGEIWNRAGSLREDAQGR